MDLEVTPAMAAAAERCNIRPNSRSLTFNLFPTNGVADLQSVFRNSHRSRVGNLLRDRRDAMSGYDFSTGGALVPGTYIQNLEVNMLAFGGVLQVAETITTDRGDRMTWPTADDTSNIGEQVGENVNIDNSNAGGPNPAFAQVFWDAYTYSSKAILVPFSLLQDSFTDLPTVLGQMQGERLGRILASKFTTGSGANTPKGIITAATLGVTAASATAITFDEVMNLEHSIDPAYRTNAGYMCHDNVFLALRKLKDSQGQYLWQNGIDTGSPDRLNGHPLTISMEMASSVATTAKTLLFGQLSKYKVRRVGSVRLYRLEERYRDKDQDGFIALLRADGNLLTAGTAPVKYLQQA
jgi:HK97 family phage major capsid protein